jgi:hypothetical protein
MTRALQLLHILAGLQALTALFLFGAAGLVTSWHRDFGTPTPTARTYEVPFTSQKGATLRQIADRVYTVLKLPGGSSPVPDFALHNENTGPLALKFYSPNGVTKVDVHPGKLQVREERVDLPTFLSNMHATTLILPGAPAPICMKLWSVYIELSTFAFLFLTLSGIAQWLLARPKHRYAQAACALGTASIATLYWLMG